METCCLRASIAADECARSISAVYILSLFSEISKILRRAEALSTREDLERNHRTALTRLLLL